MATPASTLAVPRSDAVAADSVGRRVKAIFVGSVGNLVEWYDFYCYAAFSLYFASSFFPSSDPVAQSLSTAAIFALGFFVAFLTGFFAAITCAYLLAVVVRGV